MNAPDGEELARYQALHDEAIASARASSPERQFSGRGIVIAAGGPRYFTCAWVCINVLREVLGCTLPIEVWYLGPGEMSEEMIGLLEPLDVDCIDALATDGATRVPNGWELKPVAIARSRFKDVLFLDADVVPVVDPTYLFSTPEYRRTGALFWPDIWRFDADHPIWQICGIPYRDEPSVETGQIVIDKERSWPALNLTRRFDERSELYYRYTRGGAETFHLAWRMLDTPYALVPHLPDQVTGMLLQRDFEGRPLFQHRTTAKWVAWGEKVRIAGFVHEERCTEFLAQLRERWDGRVAVPRPHPLEGVDPEEEVIRTRRFLYRRIGSDDRILELLPGHQIGQGRDVCECGWYMCRDEGEPSLVLEGAGERGCFSVTCTLIRQADGVWRGRWLQFEKMPVELVPLGTGHGSEGEKESIRRIEEHNTAEARRSIGMYADLLEGESLRPVSKSVLLYDKIWSVVRGAKSDPRSLVPALQSLLLQYCNDEAAVRARLRAEFTWDEATWHAIEPVLAMPWRNPRPDTGRRRRFSWRRAR